MKRMLFLLLVLLIGSASSLFCSAQVLYGSYYHDIDSGGNLAVGVGRNADSTLLLVGGGNIRGYQFGGIQLSPNGSQMLNVKMQKAANGGVLHIGYAALLAQPNGDYITHQNFELHSTPAKRNRTVNACMVRYRPNGDTVWVRTYTDTNAFAQSPSGISQSSTDSSFVMDGQQYSATGTVSLGFLMFIDSAGVKRREVTYQHPNFPSTADGYTANFIYRAAFLPDGKRVLATASARTHHTTFNGIPYNKFHPWLFVCDTQGRVLKQRVMPSRYGGGGTSPYSGIDRNGGYYLVGGIDSIVDPLGQPTNDYSFPKFLMHLDTNLNTEWTYSFGDSSHGYYFYTVKQLRNGNFLFVGSSFVDTTSGDAGWLAVVDRTGTLKWSRRYHKSTRWDHQLFDAVENADGSITAVGYGKSDTSAWQKQADIWVLNVDSMGCEGPGLCGASLAVDDAPAARDDDFKLYPNPTSGAFTLESKGGEAVLYDLLGTVVWRQHFGGGKEAVQLPRSLAAGTYLVRFSGTDGAVSQTRLVYKP